jgi:hypothetical protein
MLHQRSEKNSHLDTILYEIEMLRHCSRALAAKKVRAPESDETQAEYNLVIEGFLIHLRNLLAFFTTQHSRGSDLRLDRPEVWLEKPLKEKEYVDLRDQFQAFNDSHGVALSGAKKLDCYDLISKFLQHCTPERYEQAMWWDIEKMSAEIEPALIEFKKRFSAPAKAAQVRVWASPKSGHSTATIGKSAVLLRPKGLGIYHSLFTASQRRWP